METVLSTQGISKKYGRINALNNFNIEIKKGTVHGLLGPNGSGKTTFLALILDVIKPTAGDYKWFDGDTSHENRKKIGSILEHPVFYPYMTGYQNLEIAAKIKGSPKSQIDKTLKKVGLYERKNDKFKTYSLGMKQRLAIASALLNDPLVMIFDEPTNGLDPQGIADIRELIITIAKEGKTIILASHLLDEVQKVCTHFTVLQKGNHIHTGTVDEVDKANLEVEVKSEDAGLEDALKEYKNIIQIRPENTGYIVSINDQGSSAELNKFLFERGITASHLIVKKNTLEKQFLKLLSESE